MAYDFTKDRFTNPELYEGEHLVVIEYKDGEHSSSIFTEERNARAYIEEELKWENTKRIQCPSLLINELGDFATFTN